MKKISMTDDKKEKLKSSGFQVGSIAEFLDLSPEEQFMIENVIIRNGKPIGICGEAASDPVSAKLFIEYGVTSLSASPALLPSLARALRL